MADDLEAIIHSTLDAVRPAGGDEGGAGDVQEAVGGDESPEEGAEGVEGGEEAPEGTQDAAEGDAEADDDAAVGEEGDEEGKEAPVEAAGTLAAVNGAAQPAKAVRENRIPYSRHVKITENAVKKATEALATQHTTALAQVTTQLTQERAERAEIRRIEAIMVNEPERFITMLPHLNPKYGELFGAKTTAAPADMPGPDIDLGDGKRTYSLERLEERMAWERQQGVSAATAAAQKVMEPITMRQQAEAEYRQKVEHLDTYLDGVRKNWDGFQANEADILAQLKVDGDAAIAAGQKLPEFRDRIVAAYQKVVIPKLKSSGEAERQKAIAELKKRPVSTSVVAGVPVKKKVASEESDDKQSTEDVIFKAIAPLKGKR